MSESAWLVVYDYGQGGVWAYVRSPSRDRIAAEFPDLTLVDEVPTWLSASERAELPVLDIDSPTGLLADLRRS